MIVSIFLIYAMYPLLYMVVRPLYSVDLFINEVDSLLYLIVVLMYTDMSLYFMQRYGRYI